MKDAISALILVGLIAAGAYWFGLNRGKQQIRDEVARLEPQVVTLSETTYVEVPKIVYRDVPAVVEARSDTSYTATLDFEKEGAKLHVEYLHPEKIFSKVDLSLPPAQIIRDTLIVTYPPMIVVETKPNWYFVGGAFLVGYLIHDMLKPN